MGRNRGGAEGAACCAEEALLSSLWIALERALSPRRSRACSTAGAPARSCGGKRVATGPRELDAGDADEFECPW